MFAIVDIETCGGKVVFLSRCNAKRYAKPKTYSIIIKINAKFLI